MCTTLVLFMCTTLVLFVCTTLVLFVCNTLVLFMCSTLVLFVCTTNSHQGVAERGWVAEKRHIQIFLQLFGSRAQLATAWSTGDTCTVCGHPTMSNYLLYHVLL